MTVYQVQRQRTAGAYKALRSFKIYKQAVGYLSSIAKQTPSMKYDGGDSWKDSNDIHNVNRYRIVKISID